MMTGEGTGRSLDLERYVPYFLTSIANTLSWKASRDYLERFRCGINEWRMLSSLVIEPGATAVRVCEIVGFNKSTASRSFRRLESAGWARADRDPEDVRRQSLCPTPAGYSVHEEMVRLALRRERQLLAGFDDAETDRLLALLVRLRTNIRAMVEDH